MSKKPRLLFLSQCLPFPPHSGVTNRTFNILRQLAKAFDVTLIAHSRRNHQGDAAARARAIAALEKHGVRTAAAAPIPAEGSRLRRVWDHTRSVITRRPYTYYEYRNAGLTNQLRATLASTEPAMVHLDSLDLFGWLDELPPVPVTCTHHNIESELLRLRGQQIGSVLLARYIHHQAALIERIERKLCARFELNVMMSELDAARLARLAPRARTTVVPNGVDTQFMRPRNEVERIPGRVVFVGPSYMFPNRDAIDFFLEAAWPSVRAEHPSATLVLVGRASESDRSRFERVPGVQCAGYVPDIRPFLAEADCCIAPLRVGGGTRLKILDYWAMGAAVVSTSIGCEGLDAVDGENILVRDTAEEFGEAVGEVLRSRDRRESLGRAARQTAEEVYSWDIIGKHMVETYGAMIERSLDRSRMG